MTNEQLHALLTERFSLVPDPIKRADSCTYFLRKVEWHPAISTRTVRVFYDHAGEPSRLQLCASSDDNNTVLLHQPFDEAQLAAVLSHEIALVEQRLAASENAQ